MTSMKNQSARFCKDRKEHFHFLLFIAGSEPNSVIARQNLKRLCLDRLPGRHTIEIINVLQDTGSVLKYKIIITPTLVMVAPKPVTVYGNLSDTQKVLASLEIEE